MPKLLRSFVCEHCGRDYERFIDTQTHYIQCTCGSKAYRVIGMPTVKLEGITGAFPDAHRRWAKIRIENAKQKAEKRK